MLLLLLKQLLLNRRRETAHYNLLYLKKKIEQRHQKAKTIYIILQKCRTGILSHAGKTLVPPMDADVKRI